MKESQGVRKGLRLTPGGIALEGLTNRGVKALTKD